VTQLQNAFVPPDNADALKANAALIALLRAHPYITRLYTRISPEEMTVDPVFVPASSQVDVTNIHDSVAANPCAPAAACTFTYCGAHGMCLPIDSRTDGCYCDSDTTAMLTPTFGGQPTVYCEPVTTDVLGAAGAGNGANVCSSFDCGEGSCTLINGNPTCQCTPGHVAMTTTAQDASAAVVRCVSQSRGGLDAGGIVFGVDAGRDAGAPHASTGAAGLGMPSADGRVTTITSQNGVGCSCRVGRAASPSTRACLGLIGVSLAVGLRRRARAQGKRRAAEQATR
jgi:MYXO-CTERM domain-containing protein